MADSSPAIETRIQAELRASADAAAASLGDDARTNFCVVVPAYNEAEMIPDLVRELREGFDRHDLRGEIVLVDDGSTDGTGDLAEREAAGWDAFRVVRHRVNLGKTEGMVTGAEATEKTWIVLFDADLQHLPDEIPRFLERLQEGWDIVTGRKVGAYEKRGVSAVYNALGRRIFDVPVSDMNSMKAYRRETLLDLHLRHDWHRYFVVLAHARGWSVSEIDITLFPRRAGTSKFTGPWRVAVGLLDLLAVGFLLRFSQKPLVFFGSLGAALFGSGVLVGLVALWFRFVLGTGFRPLLYLVILLTTIGVLLVVGGFLAEMVAQLRGEISDLRRRLRQGGGGGA